HGLGQQDDGTLRGAIGDGPRTSGQAPSGSGVDDRTAFRGHDGDYFAGHEEDGFYIDGHHRVPILLADLKGGGSADDARIVEEYVNATEFADGAFDHAPAVGRAGHVGALKDRAASGGGDFARELFASFL